jgi:LPXTG-motif cell wall-anchored protein
MDHLASRRTIPEPRRSAARSLPGTGRRRSLLRRMGAAVLAAALAGATLVTAPTAAQAAPNPAIVVGDVVLTSTDGGQATVGDTMTLSGTWDATAADPQPGDTFTIGLPAELGFEAALPFQLVGEDGTVWGNCLTDPVASVVTCTLTDAVIERPELVRGTFELQVEARVATTERSVVLELNGEPTSVELPGSGGIDDGIELPTEWTKTGSLNGDKWSVRWRIELPGSRLAGEDAVTILERLSDNHVLCEPANLRIETVRGDTVVDVTNLGTTSLEVAEPYDFSISLTAPEGGFDRDVTYRVMYDTCTPDREIDPKGTQYTNEATIDVWGESSGVIGVEQDWSFDGDVDKVGSVLGGANRNGVIQWTVRVDGDYLAGRPSVSVTEQLSGPHELCIGEDGSPEVRGLRIQEQYGPSTVLRRTLGTDLLERAVSVTSPTAFEIDLSPVAGSGFAFLPAAHLYTIEYQTCATTDGLPAGGTDFGNRVSVDGAVDSATPTVPGRTFGKSGELHGSTVVLDGAEYLPQTTVGWRVTVPGEAVADITSDLTFTDTLTGAHEVCLGSGGELTDRLGLRVEARDQIQNGGLATVDLTGSATATLDGSTITITVPRPSLPLPGGGTETGFSHEYQYVVTYTTCTTSGGMDAPGTSYSNAVEVAGRTLTSTETQEYRAGGTGEGVARGSVSITKELDGSAAAALVPEGTVFSVHVRERDPQGVVQAEYDLQVPLDGEAVSGPNPRGRGWTMELSEPTMPSVAGVVFGTPRFQPSEGVTVSEDGTTAIATITPAANIGVTLTNTPLLGSLEVSKVVEGGAAGLVDADREFAMTASIDVSALGADFPAQPDREFVVTAGEPVVLDGLPIGAVVTIAETVPADDDTLTWGPARIEPGSIEVLPGHATTPAAITVTNTVERTVGTFALSKLVTGAEAGSDAVPSHVTVTATWDQEGTPGSATLELPTDGTPVPLGHDLLVGTEVTLTETPLLDGSGIDWASPVWSGTGVELDGDTAVVTVGRDAEALVTLENHAATSTAGISIIKGIGGEAADDVDPGTTFPVTASWIDADGTEQSRQLTISATEPTPLGVELPAGTIVTIVEGDRPELDTVDWGSITITGEGVTDMGDGSATVVVSDQHGATTLVTVVNEANWAPGTFSITKELDGVAADHPDVPTAVTVVATWTDEDGEERSRTLEVPTDGSRVPFGESLPHGTRVVLVEEAPEDTQRLRWTAPQWSGQTVEVEGDSATITIGAASDESVVLTNAASAVLGSLVLTKATTGTGADDVPAGTTFPVVATWTDLLGEQHETAIALPVGTPMTIDSLPLGVPIHLQEGETELPDSLRWTGADWRADGADIAVVPDEDGRGATVTITGAAGSVAALTLENELAAEVGATLPVTGMDAGLAGLVALGAAVLLLLGGALVLSARRRGAAE